ncbi:MAG: hypothetical protein FWF20_09945 [Betaproteobacteria bacterium]|nr:hypothetical protein [Betaproteobacteria bacterium]MCL2887081.1 hypothetical protein [Betaproteobacteria bacterium]
MPTASFSFGNNPKRTMQIYWHYSGFEKYVLDGKTISTRWDIFNFSGERVFYIDGQQLKIVYRLSRKEFYSRALLGDEIIVQELFPDMAKSWADSWKGWDDGFWKKIREECWRSLVAFVIWLVIALVILSAINHYKHQKNSAKCTAPANKTTPVDTARAGWVERSETQCSHLPAS